jgi:capsid protein
MSLQTRLESLVVRLAAEFRTVHGQAGSLANLSTTDKTSLVAAINELRSQIDAVAASTEIDDANAASLTTTFSADKITTLLDALKADLLGGADAAFDTLKELQDAVLQDQSGIAALLAAIDKRVRFDAAQTLTNAEQTQARDNIGTIAAAAIGDPDVDLVAVFETALTEPQLA